MLLKDAVNEYLLDCRIRKMSERTIRNYRTLLSFLVRHETGTEGVTMLEDVRAVHIKHYLLGMEENGRKPQYINDVLKVFKVFFKYCVQEGYLAASPAARLHNVKQPKVLIRTFSEAEIRRLLSYFSHSKFLDIRNRTILALFFETGIRFNEMATMKLELLKVRKKMVDEGVAVNDLFINRNMDEKTKPTQMQRGARVTKTVEGYKNNAANGRYYYIDDIISFDEDTKAKVFNVRMRIDLYNLFPELFNNNIRKQDTWTYYATTDKTPGIPAENFIFPIGYLDNVDMNADGDFIYQGARNWYWSFQGDEFNLRSDNNSYDITFRLPTVPTGTYQIRLGFCLIPSRGIGQFYIDGKPQGIPLDMRSDDANWANRYGWKALNSYSATQVEEKEAMKKNLHNQGWYHGAGGYFHMSGTGHPDTNGWQNMGNYYCNIYRTIRRVICSNMTLNEEEVHTMRIKSVLALGGAELMIDYIEIVPKSVYGIDTDGEGEDEY